MEIRISLDRVEPPAGRLRLVPGPEPAPGPAEGEAIPFTGWLGLLRALSEVVGPVDGEHLDRADQPGPAAAGLAGSGDA